MHVIILIMFLILAPVGIAQIAQGSANFDYYLGVNPQVNAAYLRSHSLAAYAHPYGTFVFNPRKHMWYAYDEYGDLVKSGRASGGKGYCPDIGRSCRTIVGYFRVISKGGAGCISSKYPVGEGGAPMPYCMFFSKYYAIHGSYDVPNYNASHGCIRVHPSAARWLSNEFVRIGTRVIVLSY